MAEKIDRIKTGVPGLDDLIEGGIPRGNSLLVAGSEGTGKTILVLDMLYNMAKAGEKVLFGSVEEDVDKIRRQLLQFGKDVKKLEEKGLFTMYTPKDFDIDMMEKEIEGLVKKKGITVTALDSLSMIYELGYTMSPVSRKILKEEDKIEAGYRREDLPRKRLFWFIRKISNTGTTPVFIDEAEEAGKTTTKYGVAEYIVDGVIILNFMPVGAAEKRTLLIRKIRETKHSEDPQPIEIVEEKGIVVKPSEKAFEV